MIKIKVSKFNFEKEINKKINKENILNNVIEALKLATPIDTGEARNGWKIENGNIINNVDYIDKLNSGSSQQAPQYFIEKTLLSQKGILSSGTIVRSK